MEGKAVLIYMKSWNQRVVSKGTSYVCDTYYVLLAFRLVYTRLVALSSDPSTHFVWKRWLVARDGFRARFLILMDGRFLER